MKTYKYEIQLRTGKTETVEANGFDAMGTSIIFYGAEGNFLAIPHDRYLRVEKV